MDSFWVLGIIFPSLYMGLAVLYAWGTWKLSDEETSLIDLIKGEKQNKEFIKEIKHLRKLSKEIKELEQKVNPKRKVFIEACEHLLSSEIKRFPLY